MPCYLNGTDGIFNKSYYDLLIGMDATVFPSYYEPWGYTPLESVAFGVPTVTTTLSGFGQWAMATAPKAAWSYFIKYYVEAFDIALESAKKRIGEINQ